MKLIQIFPHRYAFQGNWREGHHYPGIHQPGHNKQKHHQSRYWYHIPLLWFLWSQIAWDTEHSRNNSKAATRENKHFRRLGATVGPTVQTRYRSYDRRRISRYPFRHHQAFLQSVSLPWWLRWMQRRSAGHSLIDCDSAFWIYSTSRKDIYIEPRWVSHLKVVERISPHPNFSGKQLRRYCPFRRGDGEIRYKIWSFEDSRSLSEIWGYINTYKPSAWDVRRPHIRFFD